MSLKFNSYFDVKDPDTPHLKQHIKLKFNTKKAVGTIYNFGAFSYQFLF
jgi:hypothetical protein